MLFGTLPKTASRRSFLPSILLHGAFIAVLSVIRFAVPASSVHSDHTLTFTAVVPPPVEEPPARAVVKLPAPKPLVLPSALQRTETPSVRLPEPAVVPEIRKPAVQPVVTPSLPAPPPRPAARSEVFASVAPAAASPKPTTVTAPEAFHAPVTASQETRRPAAVRSGVFGATEVRSSSRPADVRIAAAGFGDVAGAGQRAERRVNAAPSDAGFGGATGAATAQPRSTAAVQTGAFGGAAPAILQAKPTGNVRTGAFDPVAASAPQQKARVSAAPPKDVQILFKPRPVYTDEARKLKIEGEVQLEVVFAASGEVKVLRVVKGLGHGLDEAAVQAASSIRFKPAEQDGHAVSSTAIARITFQLAY